MRFRQTCCAWQEEWRTPRWARRSGCDRLPTALGWLWPIRSGRSACEAVKCLKALERTGHERPRRPVRKRRRYPADTAGVAMPMVRHGRAQNAEVVKRRRVGARAFGRWANPSCMRRPAGGKDERSSCRPRWLPCSARVPTGYPARAAWPNNGEAGVGGTTRRRFVLPPHPHDARGSRSRHSGKPAVGACLRVADAASWLLRRSAGTWTDAFPARPASAHTAGSRPSHTARPRPSRSRGTRARGVGGVVTPVRFVPLAPRCAVSCCLPRLSAPSERMFNSRYDKVARAAPRSALVPGRSPASPTRSVPILQSASNCRPLARPPRRTPQFPPPGEEPAMFPSRGAPPRRAPARLSRPGSD